jgi:hypothetical protein
MSGQIEEQGATTKAKNSSVTTTVCDHPKRQLTSSILAESLSAIARGSSRMTEFGIPAAAHTLL